MVYINTLYIYKEGKNKTVFTYYIVIDVENPKESTKNQNKTLLELISDYSKVWG